MSSHTKCNCCPQNIEESMSESKLKMSRRNFVAMGGVLLGGLSLPALQTSVFGAVKNEPLPGVPNPRKPLIVKPVLVYDVSQRKEEESYRMWGGIQSAEEANEEVIRIKAELAILKQQADYPIEFLTLLHVPRAILRTVFNSQTLLDG